MNARIGRDVGECPRLPSFSSLKARNYTNQSAPFFLKRPVLFSFTFSINLPISYLNLLTIQVFTKLNRVPKSICGYLETVQNREENGMLYKVYPFIEEGRGNLGPHRFGSQYGLLGIQIERQQISFKMVFMPTSVTGLMYPSTSLFFLLLFV
jgi:hypothetical protein